MQLLKSILIVTSFFAVIPHSFAMKTLDAEFYKAAGSGDLDRLKERIQAGVNINAQRPDTGETALHNAVSNKQVAVVKELLDHNADVSARTIRDEKTALDLAVEGSRRDYDEQSEQKKALFLEIIDLFFSNNSELDREFLKSIVFKDKPKMTLLLNQGANPNVRARGGNSIVPLIYINTTYYSGYTLEEALEYTQLLLSKNPNPDVRMNNGDTPLMQAVRSKNALVVQALLEAKADPNLANNDRQTALHIAEERGYENLVTLLLARGADPNVKGSYQRTPLHGAAGRGNKNIALLLLQAGADPNAQDADKRTPLGEVVSRNATLMSAQVELVKALLEKGANPNIPSGTKTPLEIAKELKPRFRGYEKVWDDAIAMLEEASTKFPGAPKKPELVKPTEPTKSAVTPKTEPAISAADLEDALQELTRALGELAREVAK